MKKALLFLFACFSFSLFAQDGALDETFNVGSGLNYDTYSILQLSTGKIIVGGQFNEYNGNPAFGIMRLNEDGSHDTTFNAGTATNNTDNAGAPVYNIYEEENGKILILGAFYEYNGVERRGIARLNADGSLDSSFTPVQLSGSIVEVVHMVKQGDKYIFSGHFRYITNQGVFYENVIRLNNDGSLDPDFPAIDFPYEDSTGYAMVTLAENNKMLITGKFTNCNGTDASSVIMLNEDGTVDNNFHIVSGQSPFIKEVIKLSNGKYILGGLFPGYDDFIQQHIIRLNANGTVDETFVSDVTIHIQTMVLQPDGKIIIAGGGTSFEQVDYILRLNPGGTIDNTFNSGEAGFNNDVYKLNLQQDGKLLAVGWFTEFNGVSRNKIARINGTTVLSINDNMFSAESIYPNPTTGKLHINLITDSEAFVYDISGKLVLQKRLPKNDAVIDISNYNSGLYFVKLVDGNKTITKKIIKN